MRNNFVRILFLILPFTLVTTYPIRIKPDGSGGGEFARNFTQIQNIEEKSSQINHDDPRVIGVRITSSVAVDRGNNRPNKLIDKKENPITYSSSPSTKTFLNSYPATENILNLAGANLEYIKQIEGRKEAKPINDLDVPNNFNEILNERTTERLIEAEDSVAEPSYKSVITVGEDKNNDYDEDIENVPLARSISLPSSSSNYLQSLPHKRPIERGSNQKLTTVSFNIVHDSPTDILKSNSDQRTHDTNNQQIYNEPSKIYSKPAEIYSEPAKFYSEPAKVYSEPAQVYSEPAKVYSEPAKIYSQPAKFYSEPASLHLEQNVAQSPTPWQHFQSSLSTVTQTTQTTPFSTDNTTPSHQSTVTKKITEIQPENNYEVDEKVSVLTDGKSHGVQESSSENCKQDNCKVGYVVEGRQYRKYRVEERTPDGYIVGEYGVVRNEDGALRGVRYTADSDASPRLIYDALMKFLQLK